MNNIRIIREIKGISVKYIAYNSNISVSYISMLERNLRKNPSYVIMENISDALKEPIEKVFFQK